MEQDDSYYVIDDILHGMPDPSEPEAEQGEWDDDND